MKKRTIFALCGIVCFITAATVFPAQNAPDLRDCDQKSPLCYESKKKRFEKCMDEYIAQQMEENNAIGFSIVVVENNTVVYQKGFGYADKENVISVDSSTLFHIGSITKLFTGIGIMQLAQKRLIDIDAPIQHYIPEFSIKYHIFPRQPITIRSIMAHQSGIFGDKGLNSSNAAYPADDFRTYPEFAKNEYAAYHPDYITAYSNFAVSLLGLIIERVSHQKYEDYVYNNILKPCGMRESSFDPKNEHESLLAKGYDKEGNLYPYYYIGANPAGFLASNSENMAQFIKMILNNGYSHKRWIVFPNTLHDMYRLQNVFLPMNLFDDYAGPYNFGLSWMLENKSFNYLGKVVGHGGNLPPYNSNLLIAKDKNIGVFVTANKDDYYPDGISYFALAQAAKIFRKLDKPDLPEVPYVTTMPEHLKKFSTGTYCVLGANPIEIYAENDTLYFQELHSQRIPFVYHADDWMSLCVNNTVVPDIRFAVRYIDTQKVLCQEYRDTFSIHRMIIGNSFLPKDTLSDEQLKLTGVYSETSSGQPSLLILPDTLSKSQVPFIEAVTLSDGAPYILQQSKDATWIIQGLGRGAQETVYKTGDTLNYSGYKFVKSAEAPTERKITPMAAMKAHAPTIKSPEDVVNDLKKSIKKMSRL